MNTLPTILSQIMDFLPLHEFRKCVRRYRGDFAVKLHTLLDLRGSIPSFIKITDGKTHDMRVLDDLIPEPGCFYILDRAYIDYGHLFALHQNQAFFVIRAKSNI